LGNMSRILQVSNQLQIAKVVNLETSKGDIRLLFAVCGMSRNKSQSANFHRWDADAKTHP
jgi:hypothetical protein